MERSVHYVCLKVFGECGICVPVCGRIEVPEVCVHEHVVHVYLCFIS